MFRPSSRAILIGNAKGAELPGATCAGKWWILPHLAQMEIHHGGVSHPGDGGTRLLSNDAERAEVKRAEGIRHEVRQETALAASARHKPVTA